MKRKRCKTSVKEVNMLCTEKRGNKKITRKQRHLVYTLVSYEIFYCKVPL